MVHHGGIGTTAQVLAAGVPQLIVPLAFDQPDQAMRVERLHAGLQIPRKKFNGANVAAKLQEIFQTPVLSESSRELSKRLNGPQAIGLTCDVIENSFRHSLLSQ